MKSSFSLLTKNPIEKKKTSRVNYIAEYLNVERETRNDTLQHVYLILVYFLIAFHCSARGRLYRADVWTLINYQTVFKATQCPLGFSQLSCNPFLLTYYLFKILLVQYVCIYLNVDAWKLKKKWKQYLINICRHLNWYNHTCSLLINKIRFTIRNVIIRKMRSSNT